MTKQASQRTAWPDLAGKGDGEEARDGVAIKEDDSQNIAVSAPVRQAARNPEEGEGSGLIWSLRSPTFRDFSVDTKPNDR
jgi:hypothetical protein